MATTYQAEWDDRAEGFRVDMIGDDDDFEVRPLPHAAMAHGTPLFLIAAAAVCAAPSADWDGMGLIWKGDGCEAEAKKAALAATEASKPLTKPEREALGWISLLGKSKARKKTIDSLRARYFVDAAGALTIAGKAYLSANRDAA